MNVKLQFPNDELCILRLCKILPVHTQFKNMLLKELKLFNEKFRKAIVHPVYTRAVARNQLCTQRANNAYGERSATRSYLVPRLLNELPADVRDSIAQKNIKTKLKRHFLTLEREK